MLEAPFTPEQEVRIAEIVRTVLLEQEQAEHSKSFTIREATPDDAMFARIERVVIAGSEIILDAPRIVATSVIQVNLQQS